MPVDVMILNSGEWLLFEELPSEPWHILIYRLRSDWRNELHLWLPGRMNGRSSQFAFRRFWMEGTTRWCVEAPPDPDRPRSFHAAGHRTIRFRFTTATGSVLWSHYSGSQRLADLTDAELSRLRRGAAEGPFSSI